MDFVTFEIAKKLKKKGLKMACIGHFLDGHFFYNKTFVTYADISHIAKSYNDNEREILCVDLPVISQVLKWLRQEKNIHISIDYQCRFNKWYWCAYSIDKAERVEEYSEWIYKDYEEAALAGINYILDNVI